MVEYDVVMPHFPCPGGCGELADECACPNPNPFGSMTIGPPATGQNVGRPSPSQLWSQAVSDMAGLGVSDTQARYRELMIKHGHLVQSEQKPGRR